MSERKNNLREIKSEMVDISNHTEEEFKSYASITIKGLLDWCFEKSEWEDSIVIEQSIKTLDTLRERLNMPNISENERISIMGTITTVHNDLKREEHKQKFHKTFDKTTKAVVLVAIFVYAGKLAYKSSKH